MPLPMRQVHLDFHTSEHIPDVGGDFDAEAFAQMLSEASVNSVNCFSKCHHGLIYHDTRFKAKHPTLRRNLLGEQIEACHRRGIRVPIYISAGFDVFMGREHPEWIQVDSQGKLVAAPPLQPGWPLMCFNSPYVDYVVEQTEEVMDLFGSEVDGFWFDIIIQYECCCRGCMDRMIREGFDPESKSDRLVFSDLVTTEFKVRMTAAIRSKSMDCTIFYNCGHIGPYIRDSLSSYTHLELESLPSGGWGYDHFPVTARYARNLGLEILGMTGRFNKSWADFGGFKNKAALEYECFTALAVGAGCSVGDQLHPSGGMVPFTYELIGDVYRQVAEKENWCAGSKAVVEIGVINPEIVRPGAAQRMDDIPAGVHRMLEESHYQYDFADFDMDLSRYRLIILPDEIRLNEAQSTVLNRYVRGGGKLLLSYESGMGSEGYDFLIEGMPVSVSGPAGYSPDFLVAVDAANTGIPETEHVMYERGFELELLRGAASIADVWIPYFERSYRHFSSHFHTPVERPAGYPGIAAGNNIIYVAYPIFGMYKRHGAKVYRDFVRNAIRLLLPDEEKLVQTGAPTTAEITLNYQTDEHRYVLHILHYVPERRYAHADTIEDVIPLYNVDVSLKLPPAYDNVTLVPEGVHLLASGSDDRLHFSVPEVSGHRMVAISQ